MSTSISIRLPDGTAKALEDLARATDRPRSYLIIKAVEAVTLTTRLLSIA